MEEARAQFETNYFGVVRMTKAVLPQMRQRRSGRIITIGSMAGLIGMPFQDYYSASKYALEGLTEALRLELLPFNIHVTIIDPGDFKTSFTSNRHTVTLSNVPNQYHDRFHQMLAFYQSEEQNGSNPIIIANHIEKLLTRKATPKVRYVLGKRLQTIGILVKRIIGETYFEKILRMMWKL